jgi:hypothetical protein
LVLGVFLDEVPRALLRLLPLRLLPLLPLLPLVLDLPLEREPLEEPFLDLAALTRALTSWSLRMEWTPVRPMFRAIAQRSFTVWDRKSATVINGLTLFQYGTTACKHVVSAIPCIVREPVTEASQNLPYLV